MGNEICQFRPVDEEWDCRTMAGRSRISTAHFPLTPFLNHDGHRLNFGIVGEPPGGQVNAPPSSITDRQRLHWQSGVEQFTFSYGSFEHRWLNATLAEGEQSATLIASAVLSD